MKIYHYEDKIKRIKCKIPHVVIFDFDETLWGSNNSHFASGLSEAERTKRKKQAEEEPLYFYLNKAAKRELLQLKENGCHFAIATYKDLKGTQEAAALLKKAGIDHIFDFIMYGKDKLYRNNSAGYKDLSKYKMLKACKSAHVSEQPINFYFVDDKDAFLDDAKEVGGIETINPGTDSFHAKETNHTNLHKAILLLKSKIYEDKKVNSFMFKKKEEKNEGTPLIQNKNTDTKEGCCIVQ